MNTSKYLGWACCIALVASFTQTPYGAADTTSAKNPTHSTPTTHTTPAHSTPTPATHTATASHETWQSLLPRVKQSFHITDEEVEQEEKEREKASKYHKQFKKPFPNATSEEMKKGRELLTQSLHLAQQHIAPLEGLKKKETAYDVMTLITCVGFVNAVDAIGIATLFNEYQEGHEPHQQLTFLRKAQVIAKRVDEQTISATNIVAKAFGTKDEKIEFKDEFFKSAEPLHVMVAELKKCAAQTHKSAIEVDTQIVKLEKQTAASK